MPNQLTAAGLTVESVIEIVADLSTGYASIYGSDINLDSNTPDGQSINIYATALEDNLELLVSVYNQFSLQNAFGIQVDNLVALNGLQRLQGTNTITYVNVTVSQAITLPGQDVLISNPNGTVFTVSDQAGNQYQLEVSYVFAGAGTATLAFAAVNIGQTLVTANTITIIVTPLTGTSAVNNPGTSISTTCTTHGTAVLTAIATTTNMFPGMMVTGSGIPAGAKILTVDSSSQITLTAIVSGSSSGVSIVVAVPPTVTGTNEETDVQLKIRQGQSFQLASTGPADTIRAQLLNTPGIIDAFVPDNDTGSTVNGVPAHGIWVIVNVSTATPAQIAQVIYSKKTIGCAQKTTAGQSFSITRPAGNVFTAYWDLALTEQLYISFTLLPLNGVDTFDRTSLASQLAQALIYKLNESAFVGQVVTAMNTLTPNGFLTSIFVGTSPSPSAQQVSPSDYQHYFVLQASNIVIS